VFERFTKDARRTVLGAVTVAQDTGGERVHTGHMLAALAADPGPAGRVLADAGVTAERVRGDLGIGVDPEALRAVGIDYDEIRRAVDAEFGAGALERVVRRRNGGHRPFSAEAKQSLTAALREATAARDSRIGSEYLLLGVLAAEDSEAARLLAGYGVDVPALRTTLRPTRRAG
jgi:ATP-dependent Clp protease ATP-binding subunit ClpA